MSAAAATAELGFVERVGGVLVAPRATLRALVRAPGGKGAADAAILIALRLVCGETPRLLRAVFRALDLGLSAGLSTLVQVIGTVVPDVLAIGIAGFVLSLLLPSTRQAGRGPRREATTSPQVASRADALDVAGYAWVPYLAVQLVAAIGFTLAGQPQPAWAQDALAAVALAWSLAVWVLGLLALREAREATS